MTDLFNDSPLPFTLPKGPGFASHFDDDLKAFKISIPDGQLLYAENFLDQKIIDRTVEFFLESNNGPRRDEKWAELSAEELVALEFHNISWKQDYISMYGKRHPLPRLTAWYGEPGTSYKYSGIQSTANDWTNNKGLQYLKTQIETLAGVEFNSVLLNWYRDGSDKISWHADDEREFGTNPVIGSLNFGVTRDFQVRRIDNHKEKFKIPLSSGSALVMSGAMQHHWQHCVNPSTKIHGSRFNLTFRQVL